MIKAKYIILLALLVACSRNTSDKLRIVDANGNPVKLNRIVPEFNEQQMQKQKEALSSNNQNGSNIKFVNGNYNIMQQVNDPNFITTKNTFPDENIFADRITNFNYIEKDKKQNSTNLPADNEKNNNIIDVKNQKNSIIEVDSDNLIKPDDKSSKTAKNNISEEFIEIDDNSSKDDKNIPVQNKSKTNVANKKNKKYYIQLGIFGEKSNAETTYSKYSKISNGMIENYLHKGKNKFKVLLGPYADKNLAEADMTKVIKTGHYDVYITEKK